MALDSLKRFQREEAQGLLLLDPDGLEISPAQLEAIVADGAPTKPAILSISP
jgi:hypothetical protein